MTILATNSNSNYASSTILYNKKRFKIVAENGNCYSRLTIYIYCQTGIAQIASEGDIQGYKWVNYCNKSDERIKEMEDNIKIGIEYIKLIF